MSKLTIIAAPHGLLDGVRDALTDWSAIGLVGDFAWVTPDLMRDGQVHVLWTSDGEVRGTSIDALVGRVRTDLVRLCVLVPVLSGQEPIGADAEQELFDHIEARFDARIVRARALVARSGDATRAPELAVAGWHNVLLAPEDAAGPNLGSRPLGPTSSAAELGAPAAAALAGVVGLWARLDASPLDDLAMLPGTQVRLARSYSRHVGSFELSGALSRELLSTERGLPLPSGVGISSVYVEDVDLATEQMASHLWARHASVLRGPRESVPASEARRIGVLEALRMFFSFLGAAIRNAPRAWARGIVHRASSQAASHLQGLLFGQGRSAYSVVVRGVTGDGRPANWAETSEAIATIDKLIDDSYGTREQVAKTNLAELWQDYASAALTLADGGERNAALPAVQVGAQRGVIRNPAAIVPGTDRSFAGVPPHLRSRADEPQLLAYDALAAQSLESHLKHLSNEPNGGLAAGVALGELSQWRAAHRGTFASRVGARLAGAHTAVLAEVRALFDKVRLAAGADDLLTRVDAQQRKIARALNIVAVVWALVAIVGAVVLLLTSTFTWGLLALVVGGSVLLWLLTALIVFFRGQRELFALITARRQLLAEDEVARRNLRVALRDARRLGEAYQQFLSWSRVLAVVLQEPFGRELSFEHSPRGLVDGLPMASHTGTYSVDAQEIARAAALLRREVFGYGWLSQNWHEALASAPGQIGPLAVELEQAPELMFRQQADSPESLLVLWTQALAESGLAINLGRAQWESAQRSLQGTHRDILDRLTSSVVEAGNQTQTLGPRSRSEFMGGIDDDAATYRGRFNADLLTDSGKVADHSRVVVAWKRESTESVATTVVLTQLSDGIEAYLFTSFEPAPSLGDLDFERRHEGNSGPGARPIPEAFGGGAI